MRIFNKMKKMLLVAAALFAVNGAFAESKTFLLHGKNMTVGTDADGYSIMTGNASTEAEGVVLTLLNSAKSWSTHNSITVDGSSLATIKVSNGAQNSCVLPEGYVATKVTLYSYININTAKKEENIAAEKYLPNGYRTSYWKEFAGTSYNEEAATLMNVFVDGDLTAPDAISFDLDKVSSFTFTNGGEQACFVMKIEAESVAAEPEAPAADSLKVDEVNVLAAGKTYVLGKQFDMYKVQFTAEKDGFLSITPSQKVSNTSLKINGASSTFTKVNGGIEKKGMAAGSVFEGTFYCGGTPSAENVYELAVTFEEGVPYSPLAMTLANPADGGEWSGAAQYKQYGTKGVPHYEFSTLIGTDVKASVKIGDKVYENIKLTVDGYNPKLDITALPDTMNKAIAAGLIKSGETFTLTLSNIVDKEFAANTLTDQTFTYTLASTACTGVSPTPSTSRTAPLTDVTFSFDGTVALADTAKFYMVNLANNEVTELTGEVVEGTSVKVTVPAIEGLLPRLYNIVATGVTTAEGDKVITYGNEPGKLVASYGTGNGFFKGVTSLQNWGQVCSLKGFTATYPGEVIAVEGIATKPITFTKVNVNTGAEEEMPGVTLGYTVNGNVIEFALSEAITEVGTYRFSVPQKHFWAKDTYTEEDAKLSTPKFAYYQASITLTIDVIEPTATDVTDKLVNPNFDDANANTGWNAGSKDLKFGTSGDAQKLKDGTIFVGNIVEHWEGSAWTGDIAQTVKELPAGAYKFTMGAYVNNAGEAYIFANDSLSLPVGAAKVGEYTVYAELAEGADLKVGFKNVSGINWICLDNAHLYYYGEGTTVDMALKADWKVILAAVEEAKAAYADPIGVEALDAAVAAAKIGTIQEYLASVKAVNEAMAAFKKVNDAEVAYQALAATLSGATADAPVDATGFIANPSFEDGQSWLQNGTGGGAINQPNEWKLVVKQEGWGDMCMNETAPQDGKYMFNAWSGTVHSVDLNQAVRLPGGSYTMTAAMRTEWTHQVTNQHIYAVIGTDTIHSDTLKVASIMRPTGDDATNANEWKTVEGWQTLTAKLTLAEETVVTIGVLSTGGTNDNAGWFQLDNFRLSCTGWVDPALQPAVDSLNALVVETEAFQKTLDLTDGMQASMNEALVQNITAAKAAAEAKESVAAVRAAYTQLNMMYIQIVANIAGAEAQAAQALMGEYENPTDEAGLANAITKVMEIYSNMMSNPENTYTIADLNAAVEAMRVAKEAFIKENTPADGPIVTTYDFEDDNILFTCDSRISASVVSGEQTIKGTNENTITLASKAVRFAGANNAQNGYSFAHYDFSSLVEKAKTVTVEFDYWNTDGARAIISLGDASVRGTTGNSSKNTYSNKGAIFALGSDKNNALLNGAKLSKADYCDKWLVVSVAVDVLNATYSYSIKDKATGTEIKSASDIAYYSSEALACSQIDLFGYINNSTPALLDNIVITVEKDNRVYADYKVLYVDEAGVEIKEAAVRNGAANEAAGIVELDKESFKNADASKKYIYKSDDSEGKTIAEDGSTVITVTFREAAKYNYSVEAIDDSGSLALTLGSYSDFEGENAKAPYYAYVLNEGVLYEAAATNKEYNKYAALTADNMKVQVAYTKSAIENVVYYQEAENVEGLTKVTTGNTSVRSSNSASAYAAEADVVLTNLAPGKYKMTAVVYDASKEPNAVFSFIAGADTILKAKATAVNWSSSTSDEFTLTANTALSLAKGGGNMQAVDFVYIQKTGEAPARFDLTAYNDTVAWANEIKATLNAEDATEAELIVTIDDFIASAAQWLEETLADPEATQDDVNFIAQDLKLQVNAVMERLPILKLWPEAEALRMEADSVYASYTEPTDEAGLVNALRSFPRSPMFIMNVEELQTAIETLKTALAAFIAENEEVGGPVALSADMFKEWDKVEADAQVIGDAVSEMGIGKEIGAGAMVYGASTVDPLRYADLSAYDKMVIEGTSGVQLRILMNRALGGEPGSFNGALVEVNVTIGEDGKAEVDLTAYDYVHLNAIKTGWGSAAGTITSITLETIEPAKIAYLNAAGDADDAIYDALVAAGYAVDPLAYADVTLSDEVIESELAGYDVVVLGGSTGSGTNLAKTANLLLGKVNVLSTKSFWYKHYGANGGNPGTADAPSLSLTKAAGYEEHPIYAGIEGGEFAVFNDMGKETGRYLQSNGSFADAALAQATIGTTLGANCIGEAWVDGKGYIIIPVDGLQPSGYLTADGAQLFVNAVDYLIAGEQFEYNLVEGVRVEATQWPADIYDLSGRMIKKAATSLEGLDKGLYFIQGKKVLVK